MPTLRTRAVLLSALGLGAAAAPAAAEPLELGGFFGPRRFADDVILGGDGEGMTSLAGSVVLGPRIAKPIVPWFVPEFELAISPATTAQFDVSVFWLEPRVLARFELRPRARLRPFVALGAGMPTALSSKRGIYDSGLTAEGFAAAGAGWNPGRGLALRLDLRVGVVPSRKDAERPVTFEGEVLLGVSFPLGGRARASVAAAGRPELAADVPDRDDDGYADDGDGCPARAEDHDGFEDKDGCPDIDNDLDQVLDIVDKCSSVAEPYNGYEDDDGCPDTLPPEVDAIVGTVEGLLYGDGDTEVRGVAKDGLDKLAAVLAMNPSVRLVLVGHTDDREFLPPPPAAPPADAPAPAEEVAPPDPAELAAELGRARARAVRDALVERGLVRGRFVIETAGAEQPVSDNETPRGRRNNRRVEAKLYVPRRGTR